MSPWQANARRTKRSAGARVRPFWILIAAGGATAAAGFVFFASWPGFSPRQVRVAGNHAVATAAILRAAQIDPGRSIWMQDTRRMEAHVAAIPYVGQVTVRRYPPARIAIVVKERIPFAVVRWGGAGAIVDHALRVLEPEAADPALPILTLPGKGQLIAGSFLATRDAVVLRDAYDATTRAGLAPEALSFDRFGQLEVKIAAGPMLLLGEPVGLEEKLRLSIAIVAQTAHARRRLATIDVRAPATPVVVYR